MTVAETATVASLPAGAGGAASRPSSRRLAGRAILVTRPQGQAAGLAAAIRDAGGEAWLLPTLAVLPLTDSAELDLRLARLADYDLVVFVSANAVGHASARAAALALPGLAGVRCAAAPGPATASAARSAGVSRVILPVERFDSEGLIAALAAEGVRAARVLILRGAAGESGSGAGEGREKLARWLRSRGAEVESVACYRRVRARPAAAMLAALRNGAGPDGVVVTSSEGARHLAGILGESGMSRLAGVPMFVPHARIGAVLGALGMTRVLVTAGGDAGLMRGLETHFGGAS